MNEAIDYNALNWVRQELGKVLKQACSFLDQYSENPDNTACLQDCAKNLHQARGPLQMVGLKGADRLASEMEELVADLLQATLAQPGAALEVLMQAFLQLPDYLSRLNSGKVDTPAVLLPVINSLRAVRGVPVLEESAVFFPDLSLPLPREVFTAHLSVPDREIQAGARAARLRFQAGLLEWYRGNEGNTGLQTLHDVLRQMLRDAGLESVARVWWAAAAITEGMIAGDIAETAAIKQMFGQLDRQIKRFVDAGESVFADPLTDKLMKRLLYCIAITESSLESIQLIKAAYKLNRQLEGSGDSTAADESLAGCSDELLQTVAVAASTDIERIKERLDIFTRGTRSDPGSLLPLADELHALGNMLDMVGIEQLGNAVVEKAQLIRDMAAGASDIEESALVAVADLLLAAEAAFHNPGDSDSRSQGSGANGLYLRDGMQSVIREAGADMVRAREAIVEFIKSPGDFETLSAVPGLMSRVRGSLQLSGQVRAAVAAGRIGQFIAGELIEQHNSLSDSQFELLADAVCGVEYCIEESGEGHARGDSVLGLAEKSLAALGCACPALSPEEEQAGVVQDDAPARQDPYEPRMVADAPRGRPADYLAVPDITGLQIIDAGADEEILAIFIEEADEVLVQLGEQLPAWFAAIDNVQLLEEADRGYHTIKGSGRMVGALALGEFAWTFENLLNRVIDGSVGPGDELRDLLGQSVAAMTQLLAQVKDGNAVLEVDVNALARKAVMLSQPDMQPVDPPGEAVAGTAEAAPAPQTGLSGLPVLADDADPVIVEIFLEEAAEEITSISETMPQWISQPDNPGLLETLRCSLHNLKGSCLVTGARVMGEFSRTLGNLFDMVVEGSVEASDPVFVLLARAPLALQQLYRQLHDGVEPELDIEEMVAHAEAFVRGEIMESAAADAAAPVESSADEPAAPEENQAAGLASEDDPALLEVFFRECTENLQLIDVFLGSNQAPCAVTESLYRALHTISGISRSANVSSVCSLAGVLDDYFEGLFEGRHLAEADALDVLRDSAAEINRLIQQLPDMSFDWKFLQQVRTRVEALSKTGVAQPAEDPYSSVDSELLEVFIEEASEIIDAGENTLRAWSEEPANQGLMVEFQRQLHTLKGGARMVDITPIGDLSHTLESLLTRVVEGKIEASPELFILLQDSHDHLAGMLEYVKVRKQPADAGELTAVISGIGRDAGGGSDANPADAPEENEADHAPGSEAAVDVAVVEGLESEPVSASGPAAERAVASEPEQEPETAAESIVESEPEPESGSEPEPEPEPEPGPAMPTEPGDEPEAGEEPATEAGMELLEILPEPATLRKMGVLPPKVERCKGPRVRSEQVRVRADLLDDMVGYAGEINIYRTRMEQQISDYRYNLGELDQTIGRLREQLRQVEIETEAHILFRYEQEGEILDQDFDPLEMDRYSNLQQLSRSLNESVNDLRSIQELMENTTRESETLLLQQSRVSTDLQESLLHSRMIPFAGIAPRLRRILRQSAKELGKDVDLKLEGADGEMDRTVIERIIAPLEHMLRNAVAHGIEPPAIRRQLGKPVVGSVAISIQRERSEIVLLIEDDGAGLDFEAIRTRAIERNLLDADARIPDYDIMQFVLQSGFTTATEVTQISGRGVGMDVVNGEVKQLGGSLHIGSTAGVGTVFTVRLPYTLAVNQALQVKAGEETFCIPLGSVEGVARISPEELADCYQSEDKLLEYAGSYYQLKHLGSLLGCGGVEHVPQQGRVPVLLVRLGEKRVAFHLEAILGSREIVIKPLGAQLSNIDGISGATILGDGRVVLILDVMSISRLHGRAAVPDMRAASRSDEHLHVMVVDDSITVRKVTTRLLGRNGFRVLTAKDGVDAMGQLQKNVPDIMLLDIEMPRMDGFELATHIRNDDRLKHVPIIMITSRTGDKHRERAKQIGVNAYLGKPYQESELLESIQDLIEVRKREVCA